MSERMKPEVEKMLRDVVAHGYGLSDDEAEDLLNELDAVRRERDEAREWREAWIDGKRREQAAKDGTS